MIIGISFSCCSLIYNIILLCIFLSKKRIKSKETKLYFYLLITALFGALIALPVYFSVIYSEVYPILSIIISKMYLVFIHTWLVIINVYFLLLIHENLSSNKKFIIFWILYYIIGILSIYILPIYFSAGKNNVFTYGPAVNLSFILGGFSLLLWVYCMIRGKNVLKNKRFIPMFVMLIVGTIAIILQKINPSWLFMTTAISIVTNIMYHTIENPDMKMLNQVELARDSAERANRAKTEFLSSMSHEIRTPLNAIVGFSECISKAESLESAKEDAKDIITASQNLLEIVNGILDISKIESGKMELVETNYDLVKIGEDLTKLMIPRIGEKPIKLNTLFAPDIPGVLYGDGSKVKQIISNILTNAVKYTEKGEINFKISCINDNFNSKIIISIEDTGRGIKPEKINTLFNRFERLDEDRNTTLEGTGLGLAITKTLVEMLGGKITVQSKYGEGSVFTVCIVQRIVSLHREAKVESLDFYNDFSSKKVLIVDDNKLNIKIASRLLSEYKVNISDSESGNDVINRINNGENFDLILMDDMMPNMSGTETMKKLKEMGIKTPIVVLTANAIEGMKENYLSEGFDYYLSKPMDKKELEKVLNNFLGNHNSNNKESNLGPLPESVYKITEEDIREIDELMPRSELEKINEQVNDQVIKQEVNEQRIDDIVIKEEIKSDNVVEVPLDNSLASEVTNQLNDNLVEMKQEVVENKGSKEFLINNGINVDGGLELLGDMEMYEETLKGFLTETSHRIPEMLEFKNINNMKDYAIHAHAMKSDSKYLGFTKLAELSLNHELKGKENDLNYVMEHYDELMQEVNRIISIVNEYLGN